MIFGLTGKNGSGKSSVGEILVSRGYTLYSLSDILRETLAGENKKIVRVALIELGNRLRQQYGPSILADKTIEKMDVDKNYVIDSIRNPQEVQSLRKLPHFQLICVEAPLEKRFERSKKRNREGAEPTLAAFREMENREIHNPSPNGQQLAETARLADHAITNDQTLKTLTEQVLEILKKTSGSLKRPGWDDYFMNIAKVVSQRSNCIKRHVAAIIIKDKRIVSTGYNGTPRGIKNCNEGGCPRCNRFDASGKDLGECLCSHAEENAITQAAYHGVSIKNATLFTTFSPCLMCTKMIINSGIKEVVFDAKYSLSDRELGLLKEVEIIVRGLAVQKDSTLKK